MIVNQSCVRTHQLKLCLFIFSLIFIIPLQSNLFSQTESNQLFLTMEEAISRALTHNNQLRASEFALLKAKWDQRFAWTQLLPTLHFNTRYTRIDKETFFLRDFFRQNIHLFFPDLPPDFEIPPSAYRDSYFSSLDVSMPIFNGVLLNGLSIAKASKKMAKNLNQSTRDNIIFQVITACLNVLKTNSIVDLQQEYLELSRLNYEKAERLYNAGRYSKTESLRWKVDLQQQKATLVNSEANLRSAKIQLKRLLNLEMQVIIEMEKDLPQILHTESEKLYGQSHEEILAFIQLDDEKLIQVNAALSAAKSNEKVSKLLYRNSYASYMPKVKLNYTYAWRENSTIELDDYSPKTLMINLSIPLFTGFQNYTSAKSTYYDYRKSQEEFSTQLQNTRSILTQIVNKILNLKTQRELATTNVEYNERNYNIVEQQKEKGLVSNIDFIDAKLNLQNAKLNDIHTYYDFVSSMVELYYLLGKIESII